MSELINNREYRKEVIKDIIKQLHNGAPVEEVKQKFDETIKGIAPAEIAAIEQELINEGLGIDEVRRLCDVHLAVFESAIQSPRSETVPGHPVYTFKAENRAIEKLIDEEIVPLINEFKSATDDTKEDVLLKLREKINLLWDVDKHYSRKENLLFPYLEKYEITGPSKIMWSHDDEIRTLLKSVKALSAKYIPENKNELLAKLEETLKKIKEMILKEEKVLFDTAVQVLSEDEWYRIMNESDDIGYCLIEPLKGWKPVNINVSENERKIADEDTKEHIKFETGVLTPKEISQIFNHLPVDVTFVNKDGIVKYFSNSKERIFVRAKSIIGRKVENCHPPASVEIVERLVEALATGKKDYEDFWLPLGDKFVFIRYIAVRDENGEFMGVLEVSQNIKPLKELSGQKRIMD